MGLINDIDFFYAIAPLVGLLGRVGGPAGQAMVVDLLPKETQPEGFAILRVVDNLAVTIGPVIGGLLASHSYMFLFIGDAIASAITALIVIMVIPESMPQQTKDAPVETVSQSFRGYREVLKDWRFVMFVAITALVSLVYMQMNSTLSFFLFTEYDFSAQNFGFLLGMNAFMVVVFQFPITRRISKKNPFSMMAVGTVFYAIGFGLYGFVSTVSMFFLAMIIITIGEMIIASFSQTLAASFATEDKRGRYMAIFSYGFIIPTLFGILLAGLIMDNLDPNWIWYIGGLLASFAVVAYIILLKLVNRNKERLNLIYFQRS
jgi:MFS family permease